MTECNSLDDLVNEEPKSFWVDPESVVFEDFEEVLLDILENEVESPFSLKGLLEEDDVLVLEQPEHLDLPHDRFLGYLVFVRLFELLNCHY